MHLLINQFPYGSSRLERRAIIQSEHRFSTKAAKVCWSHYAHVYATLEFVWIDPTQIRPIQKVDVANVICSSKQAKKIDVRNTNMA